MLPPHLETAREVTLHYNAVYDELIKSGQAIPFLYPWAAVGAFAVIGYLLVDHRSYKWTRHIVYALLVAFQVWCIQTTRAVHPAAAFGVGLLSGWGLLWVFAIMVARDCQTDFVRLERRQEDAALNGSTANGHTSHTKDARPPKHDKLYWQSYPSRLADRIDWIADVFCSFRGVGWNFQVSGVPRLPKQVEAQLHASVEAPEVAETMTTSRTGIRRIADRNILFRNCVRDLIVGYFIIDIIKTVMSRDRYFFTGNMDAAAPTYLPLVVQGSYVLTKGYRLLFSLAGVYVCLREIFTLGPLFFCYIVGPKYVGLRGETWMNPMDMFGSFSNVLDKGLAGWWGGWWHQIFRYGFQGPTDRLLEALEIDKKSQAGKLVEVFAAFTLSGCLHACGSYTQLGESSPRNAFLFFFLQPFGIIAQILGAHALKQAGILQRLPLVMRRAANFALVHTWLYYTAPLLMDDFAAGGVWLFEPLAFSPLRGLGLGARDDTFFCWWNGIAFWRTGRAWWDTGIAF